MIHLVCWELMGQNQSRNSVPKDHSCVVVLPVFFNESQKTVAKYALDEAIGGVGDACDDECK